MPPKQTQIKIPKDVLDFDNVKTNLVADGNCVHPAGHCFGSDGGTGFATNLKVASGRGGEKEVWEVDKTKDEIISKAKFITCQYCQKYLYVEETDSSPKKIAQAKTS